MTRWRATRSAVSRVSERSSRRTSGSSMRASTSSGDREPRVLAALLTTRVVGPCLELGAPAVTDSATVAARRTPGAAPVLRGPTGGGADLDVLRRNRDVRARTALRCSDGRAGRCLGPVRPVLPGGPVGPADTRRPRGSGRARGAVAPVLRGTAASAPAGPDERPAGRLSHARSDAPSGQPRGRPSDAQTGPSPSVGPDGPGRRRSAPRPRQGGLDRTSRPTGALRPSRPACPAARAVVLAGPGRPAGRSHEPARPVGTALFRDRLPACVRAAPGHRRPVTARARRSMGRGATRRPARPAPPTDGLPSVRPPRGPSDRAARGAEPCWTSGPGTPRLRVAVPAALGGPGATEVVRTAVVRRPGRAWRPPTRRSWAGGPDDGEQGPKCDEGHPRCG
jgi:hypothetical protein